MGYEPIVFDEYGTTQYNATWTKLETKLKMKSKAIPDAKREAEYKKSSQKKNQVFFTKDFGHLSPGVGEPTEKAPSKMKQADSKEQLQTRIQALEARIKRVQDKNDLDQVLACFYVFEEAVDQILGPETEMPLEETSASPGIRPIAVQTEKKEVQKVMTVTVDAEIPRPRPNEGVWKYSVIPTEVYLEDLKFLPEPKSPHVPLSYQIPAKVLQQRQMLNDGSANKFWSHLLYLDDNLQRPRVHYCKTLEESEKAAALFLKDKVVGFDMEWMPFASRLSNSPRIHASMVQLANESDIALFHFAVFNCTDKELVTASLREILESEKIMKVGVSISGDAARIAQYYKIIPKGLFELSDLQNLLLTVENGGGRIPRRQISLASLTEKNLLLPLKKGAVRTSNWSKPLGSRQIEYAASDAYAGLRIYDALEEQRNELRPFPPLPACRVLVKTMVKNELVLRNTRHVSKEPLSIQTVNGGYMAQTELLGETDETTDEMTPDEHNAGDEKKHRIRLLKNPEMEKADHWVSVYSKERSPSATWPQLRAYAMWYEGGHELGEISTLWRDPPLKLSTVACYLLEAIRLESLPYEKERLRDVITHVPWRGPSSSNNYKRL